jgi:hypothetical protein
MPTATKAEFFDRHFRHRITLLETFRERFGNPNAPGALDWRTCGDLYRCAMDISMTMVRFLCEEMEAIRLIRTRVLSIPMNVYREDEKNSTLRTPRF